MEWGYQTGDHMESIQTRDALCNKRFQLLGLSKLENKFNQIRQVWLFEDIYYTILEYPTQRDNPRLPDEITQWEYPMTYRLPIKTTHREYPQRLPIKTDHRD